MSKITRQGTNQILSSSVEYHNFVFLAGMTADDLSKDVKGQTAEVLAKIDAALEANGTDKTRLLSAQIWLKDIRDRGAGLYLNRMPPVSALMAGRERYEVHILDADETASLLDRIVAALAAVGLRKILLMVSPVALEATASGWDCVIANSYSKSVLVACASRLRQRHPQVDYFPGYEIVGSAGRACYDADAVHVLDEVVERVAGYLVECYAGRDRGAEGGQESGGTSGPAAPMALR